jgi:thiol-disulfide isomerase/thioredoxin
VFEDPLQSSLEKRFFGEVDEDRIVILKTIFQCIALQPHANQAPGCVLCQPADKALLHPLMTAIMQQYRNHEVYQQQLLQLVNTLLVLVARNIALN